MTSRTPDPAELYLDHNGSTPLHPHVLKACLPLLDGTFGNPSAGHPEGRAAAAAIDAARATAAAALGGREDEIVFTSGGSEANNQAIQTALTGGARDQILVSAIEHKSVLMAAEALRSRGIEVVPVPVGPSGAVRTADVESRIGPRTALVSLMLANNETGVLQPVQQVARVCRERGVLLHVDAVAALGKVPVDVRELGCDLLTLAGHKLYAPKGCGILWIRSGTSVPALVHGCGQQRGLRSGTPNPLAIVGFAAALELLALGVLCDPDEIGRLRDELWAKIQAIAPQVRRNGSAPGLPNTLNVWFPGQSGSDLQAGLGRAGISVASGASSTGGTPSHVIVAMGLGADRARESVRFSLGRSTTPRTIARTLEALAALLGQRAPGFAAVRA